MNGPFETSTDAPLRAEVVPPIASPTSGTRFNFRRTLATIAAALSIVGLAFLTVVLVLGWLLFEGVPHAIDFIARTFGS